MKIDNRRVNGANNSSGFDQVRRAKDAKGTLKRIWAYLSKQKKALTLVILLIIITSILGILGSYLIGATIDNYIINKNLDGTLKMLGIMAIVYISNSLLTWLQTYIMVIISQKTIKNIRADLFSKFQTLSLRFFDNHPHGELMSHVTNDIDNLNNALTQGVIQFLTSVLTIIGVTIAMLFLNWIMAIVAFIIIPVILLITRKLSRFTKDAFIRRQETLGELNGFIEETIGGQEIIALFGQEEEVFDNFKVSNDNLKEASLKAEIYSGIMNPLMNFVNNLDFALVVAVGGFLTLKNLATIGIIATFVNYARQFSRPLNQLATLYNTIQAAIAGGERVFKIMDEVPDIVDSNDAKDIESLSGEVVFNDVSFGYNEEKMVLKNINLNAKPGESIALVGPTGSGKTTVINLLTRFYDINSGEIKIDGLDIKNYTIDSLRENIGVVLQDSFLFSGTIKDNIKYGRLEATDEEIIEAAKLANAHSFIDYLPDKYDTVVAAQGENLSQGQRQLISIARAILSNPNILVLDEATSNIDTRTELQIQEGLNNLMKGRTSFIIAHRLKTIEEASKIIVIKSGEIIERGNHKSLIESKGFYYELYTSQFKI
ncbi:ABC transporter family protein [Clostridium argentinense CDC 2741]|uniref:ABC transporter family protein n=1 Tax=Clostridium argentinense CDC 2741 TaxID=1418104 RepID=A0A0C1U7S7_9CLOT|nr:ABC transporter ATP-binding protein [Clostridium argentinense]ARC86246.1 multidrug ABC transporter ATP-binding protein [Clostridium argentinense]KIE47833.1 ABC transporter family protein [Clostridium argentinense CDC 2741]NFF41185.1 ABC transporter ATP-binding protein [Clostridium argentinense]NFP51814.1 ABC transporter ATP-binding protein [Clostridium argentinense]NFP73899.1 ABC transporter ATP-binding protein [Clostridium argentinense]